MINTLSHCIRYVFLPALIAFSNLLATTGKELIGPTERARLETILQENRHYNFLKNRAIYLHDATDNTSPCTIDEISCYLPHAMLALPDPKLFTILAETYKKYRLETLVEGVGSLLAIGAMVTLYWYFLIYRPRCYYQQIIDKECAQIGPVKLQTNFFSNSRGYAQQNENGERIIGIRAEYLAGLDFDASTVPYTIYHEIGHHLHNDCLWTDRLYTAFDLITFGSTRCKPYFKYLLAPFSRHNEKQADLFAARKIDKPTLEYAIASYERKRSYDDSFLDKLLGRNQNRPPLIDKLYHLADCYERIFPRLANWVKHYCFDPEHPHHKTRAGYLAKVLNGKNG